MNNSSYKLLAKDLAGRIPYGVKCQMNIGDGDYFVDTLYYVTLDGCVYLLGDKDETEYVLGQCDIKPYLFPLSSMTEEQENEWDLLHFNPLDTILEGKFNGEEERLQLISKSMTDPIQWCYKNNFDCNGLIPLGLAIDCTNLNIY